jgi:hypothetical protein
LYLKAGLHVKVASIIAVMVAVLAVPAAPAASGGAAGLQAASAFRAVAWTSALADGNPIKKCMPHCSGPSAQRS